MRYFITESQRKQSGGSCYFEFQRGKNDPNCKPTFWEEESLLLHMDIVDEIALYKIVPDLQYYGETIIDKEKWSIIRNNAKKQGAKAAEVIDELSSWAEENYKGSDYYLIIGI